MLERVGKGGSGRERRGRDEEERWWTYGDFATVEIGYRSVEIADTHEENTLAYC